MTASLRLPPWFELAAECRCRSSPVIGISPRQVSFRSSGDLAGEGSRPDSRQLSFDMKYAPFPPLGRELSRLVLGTMVFSMEALDLSFELLEAWLPLGGHHVD